MSTFWGFVLLAWLLGFTFTAKWLGPLPGISRSQAALALAILFFVWPLAVIVVYLDKRAED